MSHPLPRTLFVGKGNGSVCWYRCAVPAMALGVEWVGVVGEPPQLQFITGVTSRPMTYDSLFDYEVLVLQQPVGPAWIRTIRSLQDAGVRVLFEIDDYVQAIRKMEDHEYASSFDKQRMTAYEVAMGVCDGLIVSTEFLARRYRAFNRDVSVCPNGLDLRRYDVTRIERDRVTIGWAGGTGHREAIRPWMPAVSDVMRARESTDFVSIGQSFGEALEPEFGTERARWLPFIELNAYPAAMSIFDVVLAPSGRGNFFRGKSDLRWLEASALGIPTIADPDVYPGIEDGVTGFHARDAGEVRELLLALVDEPALRERVGKAAQAHVREHRSAQAVSAHWADVLRAAHEPAVAVGGVR